MSNKLELHVGCWVHDAQTVCSDCIAVFRLVT